MSKLRKFRPLLPKFRVGCCLISIGWLISLTITLVLASSQPVDGFFVLGGSIRRELYVAHLAKEHPQIPILISQGSPPPCIWLIFRRETIATPKVWLENCAKSTFENFYYSTPILQHWGVHKVRLITSSTHLSRAKLMAQIILGAHGIWVESDLVVEEGIPGNQESRLKTILDVIRSLFWAVFSQFSQPHCLDVEKLINVDMSTWEKQGFHCQHQVDWTPKEGG
jgi:uncharacterized SAM-binding protein YcdF (DUF218 family)